MDAALRQFGFFYVKNHGVDLDLIEKQFEVSADLCHWPASKYVARGWLGGA
jgi:isopenicillin N synthase-like dioxygenase